MKEIKIKIVITRGRWFVFSHLVMSTQPNRAEVSWTDKTLCCPCGIIMTLHWIQLFYFQDHSKGNKERKKKKLLYWSGKSKTKKWNVFKNVCIKWRELWLVYSYHCVLVYFLTTPLGVNFNLTCGLIKTLSQWH